MFVVTDKRFQLVAWYSLVVISIYYYLITQELFQQWVVTRITGGIRIECLPRDVAMLARSL